MGSGDVASAAAAGAALGAASNSAASNTSDLAAKGGQSMSDFMKSLGESGSISNASPSGAKGFDSPVVGNAPIPPPKPPEMSFQELRNHPSSIQNQPKPEPLPLAGIPQSSASPSSTGINAGSSSARPLPGQTSSPSGSGETSGIGGAESSVDQKLDKLMETIGQPKKPNFRDRLSNANDHVAKEQAATTVSINTNNTD